MLVIHLRPNVKMYAKLKWHCTANLTHVFTHR